MTEPTTAVAKATETQIARPAEPSVGQMLQAVIERGITAENVAAFEKLVALQERREGRDAERAFNQAFAAMQAAMPPVEAVKPVPNRDGTVRYKYAPYEEIMDKVRPVLIAHGFSLSFSMTVDEKRVTQTCTLAHASGHSRTNQFMARIGSGPPQSSEAQADGAAATYAKRMALCDALNIVVERDSDARAEGSPITPEQAESLRARLESVHGNERDFLAYAGASSFEAIGADKYGMLDEALRRKESKRG